MKLYTKLTTPFGELLLCASKTALIGIYFVGEKHAPKLDNSWASDPIHPTFKAASDQLDAYFLGKLRTFSLPIQFVGTPFQVRVWNAIAAIPFGKTVTYSELAEQVESPKAVRAVGSATGLNPLSIIVPCHRVVGKGGSLTGYAGGLERKERLLNLEKQ